MSKYLVILIIFLFSSYLGQAQFVNFGQDRASLKWRQINTPNFQLIYPDFFEESAQKMANLYDRLYRHSNTLFLKPRKIAMTIHPDGGISNGNVALAPRKSELYTMPPQEPTDNWLEHLCVHEFRHVVQLDKVNQGLTKGLYYLFGEIFPIAVTGIYVPMWFMEGDAVCFESSVGQMGRGRSPEFLNEMKAQIMEKGIYKFPKAILGSYKDYVPNRYIMGFYMTSNARIHYGTDIWSKALTRTGRRPYSLSPFAKSLKITMKGKRDSLWNTPKFRTLFPNPTETMRANTYSDAKRTLYMDNFSELRQIWRKELEHKTNRFDTITTHNKYYADYYYPTSIGNSTLIAYKKGIAETGAFVKINNGQEKRIVRTGIPSDFQFAANQKRIVWSEYHPHVRWAQGGHTNLSSYDLETGRYKRYRGKTNRLSPFKVDNNWGYVEINNRNQAALVIVDSMLKHELWHFEAENDEIFIHPSYADGKIVTVVQSLQGIRLESIDVTHKSRQALTENIYYELDNPIKVGNDIVYRASFNGNNAFYRLNEQGSKQILDSRFGVRFPYFNADSNRLQFSFYTSDGYKPGSVDYTKIEEKPVAYERFRLADSMKKEENWQLPVTNDSVFTSRKYNKFTHLINIHSWGPLYADLNEKEVDLGAIVYSQNKLSSFSFSGGYLLKSGYKYGEWMLNATYSGWWPVISLNLTSGREDYDSFVYGTNRRTDSLTPLYVENKAQRSSGDITVQLPLTLNKRHYNRSLQPYVRYKIEGMHHFKPQRLYEYQVKDEFGWLVSVDKNNYQFSQPSNSYQLLEYGLRFNNQTRMNEQEINPRWGQTLNTGYVHCISKAYPIGSTWWGSGSFYFPGIARNHSLSIYGGYQQMSNRNRYYSNQITSPRGISLYGYEISSMRGSYRLPLAFPDQNLGSLLYFKSVDGCLFYDLGYEKNKLYSDTYSSYGIELTVDTHIFRLTYPIHIGFRTGYETKYQKMFTNLIFSIGLSI